MLKLTKIGEKKNKDIWDKQKQKTTIKMVVLNTFIPIIRLDINSLNAMIIYRHLQIV